MNHSTIEQYIRVGKRVVGALGSNTKILGPSCAAHALGAQYFCIAPSCTNTRADSYNIWSADHY